MHAEQVAEMRASKAERSRDERRAYARGYNNAKGDVWPQVLPSPPNAVVRRLMAAVSRIRSTADGLRATFDPDDEVNAIFDAMIDEADEARIAVEQWMRAELLKAMESAEPAGRDAGDGKTEGRG